jgi:hypothetical protein
MLLEAKIAAYCTTQKMLRKPVEGKVLWNITVEGMRKQYPLHGQHIVEQKAQEYLDKMLQCGALQ